MPTDVLLCHVTHSKSWIIDHNCSKSLNETSLKCQIWGTMENMPTYVFFSCPNLVKDADFSKMTLPGGGFNYLSTCIGTLNVFFRTIAIGMLKFLISHCWCFSRYWTIGRTIQISVFESTGTPTWVSQKNASHTYTLAVCWNTSQGILQQICIHCYTYAKCFFLHRCHRDVKVFFHVPP